MAKKNGDGAEAAAAATSTSTLVPTPAPAAAATPAAAAASTQTPKEEEKKSEKGKKEKVPSIDLDACVAAVRPHLPDGVEIEVVHISKVGKRIDLVRLNGTVTRHKSGLAARDVKWFLEGVAFGRTLA